jgi:hypothetical protein
MRACLLGAFGCPFSSMHSPMKSEKRALMVLIIFLSIISRLD